MSAACIKIAPAPGTLRCAASGKLCPDGYSCRAGFCESGTSTGDLSVGDNDLAVDPTSDMTMMAPPDFAGVDLIGVDLMEPAPTCSDSKLNQAESDVDCGGPCGPCVLYKHCVAPADCISGRCVDTYCLQPSGPPNWVATTDLNIARRNGGAGTADDKLWAIGGGGSGVTTEYLVGTVWTAGTNVTDIGTSYLAVTADGTNLWIMGGRESDGLRVDRAFAGAGTWTTIADLSVARSSLTAAVGPDGKIYAIGGSPEPGATASAYGPLVESYTPPPVAAASQAWDTAPPDLPFGMFGHAAASAGGQLFVVGGHAFTGILKSTLSWKPGDTQWTTRADLVDTREDHGLVGAPDGNLYAIGGQNGDTEHASVEVYVPSLDRWFAGPPMPGGARTELAAAIGPDGRIWAIGGSDGLTTLKRVEVYGPKLSITPDNGAPNTAIQIGGTNFAANATVTVHVGSLSNPAVGTSQTSAAGAMMTPVQYVVPNGTAAGKITLYAVDNKSRYPVHLVFTVN